VCSAELTEILAKGEEAAKSGNLDQEALVRLQHPDTPALKPPLHSHWGGCSRLAE